MAQWVWPCCCLLDIKKYRLALISTASAQLCCLWGLCVCAHAVFSHGTNVHFFILCFIFHISCICVVCLSRRWLFFQMFYHFVNDFMCACVCACVFVCPDQELSGFSRLHRCRYGGISDTELAFGSSKRPIKNDTLMILWTFTCSSSELCHMVCKKKTGIIQHLFSWSSSKFIQ